MYKAMGRLRRDGLLVANWEKPALAEADGRPHRRLEHIAASGSLALIAHRSSSRVSATA